MSRGIAPTLDGRVALVTGASRGLGASVCRQVAAHGAYVFINYVAHQTAAQELLTAIESAGGRGELLQGSVADRADVETMFKTIRRRGALDILVNNAGVIRDVPLATMSENDWQDVLDTNLSSLFHCCSRASKLMIRQSSGHIVNVSSVSAILGHKGQTNYAAAKAGVIAFTRCLAHELSPYNIRVNAVAPGPIDTDTFRGVPSHVRDSLIQRCALKRAGTADEVASVVMFLLSPAASYVQGQTIFVDGGFS